MCSTEASLGALLYGFNDKSKNTESLSEKVIVNMGLQTPDRVGTPPTGKS
jgi:hypothetical protein